MLSDINMFDRLTNTPPITIGTTFLNNNDRNMNGVKDIPSKRLPTKNWTKYFSIISKLISVVPPIEPKITINTKLTTVNNPTNIIKTANFPKTNLVFEIGIVKTDFKVWSLYSITIK